MKIESKIQRKGGTTVKLDSTEYHFSPLLDGAHVAEVDHPAHQDRFLSITEGFKLYRGEAVAVPAPVEVAAPVAAPEPAPAVDAVILGSAVHPSSFDIHGKTYSLGDVVALAQTASGMSTNDWNGLHDDTRADFIDAELNKLQDAKPDAFDALDAAPVPAAEPSAKEVMDALVAEYKELFGKGPHHKFTAEKLRDLIAAQRSAKNG